MAAAIVLNPATGPVGTIVQITGSGFALLSAMTFTYAGNPITPNEGSITTDGTGAFICHITIPASPEGNNTVSATDASAGNATTAFAVTSAISLSPNNGIVGSTAVITGTGFAATSAMSFTFGGASITPTDAPITTDADGGFTAHIVIPASIKGTHAVAGTDAATNTASANFTTNPSISLDPTEGPAGESITVTGTGFAGTSAISMKIDGVSITIPSTTTGSTGGFSVAIDTPTTLTSGAHTLQTSDTVPNSASATYTVDSPFALTAKNNFSPGRQYAYNEDTQYNIQDDSYVDLLKIDVRNLKDILLRVFNNGTHGLTYSLYGTIHETDNNPPPSDSTNLKKWTEIVSDKALANGAAADYETISPNLYSWLVIQTKRTSAGQSTTAQISVKAD